MSIVCKRVYPQPFSSEGVGVHINVTPDKVEFNHKLNVWVFYVGDDAVCTRGGSEDVTGLELRDKGWFWVMDI